MLRPGRQRLGVIVAVLIAVALSSFCLGGCGGSGSSGPSPPPTLNSIAITPANATVSVGSNQQLTAQGFYSDGTTTDISSSVSWSSSDQSLASISSSGLAAAAAIGRPQITATSGGITGSTRLIVVEGAWVARFAYAVGSPTTYIYTVDAASGQLRATGSVPADAISIAIDPAGKFAYTAGTTAFAIDPANGGLTFIATYSTNYGPDNFVGVDPSGSFVYVTVGTDCPIGGAILGYAIDRISGKLTPIAGSPFLVGCYGAGPITFHPSGKFLYVPDTNTVNVFAIDPASGALAPVASSPVPLSYDYTAFAVAMDLPSKTAIAGSSVQAVSSVAIDPTTGALSQVSQSPLSANLIDSVAVTPSGKLAYVAYDDLNNLTKLTGFSIDSTTGVLTPLTAGSVTAATQAYGLVELVADPSGKFLYLLNASATPNTITTYAIDAATGALTSVGSVQVPSNPTLAIVFSP